jgi:O-antigen ligase
LAELAHSRRRARHETVPNLRVAARGGGLVRFVGLAFFFVWMLAVSLPNNTAVASWIRRELYNIRPYFFTASIAVLLVLAAATNRDLLLAALRTRNQRALAWLFFLFPVFFGISSLIKGRFQLPVVMLYVLWSLFATVVVGLVCIDRAWLRRTVAACVVANVLVWVGSVLAHLGGRVGHLPLFGRLSFGYLNPNYYAQILEVIFFGGVYFVLSREDSADVRSASDWRRGKLLLAGLAVFAFWFAMQARSRNVLIALLVACGVYLALRFVPRATGWLVIVLVAMLTAVGLFLDDWDADAINDVSSHRVALWRETIRATLAEGSALTVVWGPERFPEIGLVSSYDDLGADKKFTKYHVDNTYLEAVMEGGVLGAVLFLLPYLYLFRVMAARYRVGRRASDAWLIAIWVGIAVQGVFIGVIPNFNSPIGFFVALLHAAPMLGLGLTSRRRPAGEGRGAQRALFVPGS